MFLVAGCTSTNHQPSQSLTKMDLPKENISKKLINKKASEFSSLPNKKKVQSEFKLGKEDPFNEPKNVENEFYSYLRLKGIISDGIKNYAIISYYDDTGEIQVGQIGGQTTNLLPNGLQVENISVKDELVVLKRNQKVFKIGFPKE